MSFDNINSYKVYMQTFNDSQEYSGTWIDITKYVLSLGEISVQIDDSDYDIGVFKNSNLSLKLNNREGYFSDVSYTESKFNYKRNETLIKVTYCINEFGPECGVVTIPFLIGEEVTVFKGILNDLSARTSANKEDLNFKVLGYDSIFDNVLVNFSSLGATDSIETILYTILNQTEITNLLTVSAANINCGLNQDTDTTESLEGKTVKEALNELLLVSNSVLYINEDDEIIITDRSASATSQLTFYGQASQNGAENIIDINNYNNGIHRVFNYFIWTDTTTVSQDSTSISQNGLLKKEISSELFTNTTKRTNIMDALLAEFKDKKIEFEITVPLNYNTLDLSLLDKINIDYPFPVSATIDEELPVLGVATLGEAILPKAQWSLNIDSTINFKILNKSYSFSSHTIQLKMREV